MSLIDHEYIAGFNFEVNSEDEALAIFHSKLRHLKLSNATFPCLNISKSLCKSEKFIRKLANQDNLQTLAIVARDNESKYLLRDAFILVTSLHDIGYARNIVELRLQADTVCRGDGDDEQALNEMTRFFELNQFASLKTIQLLSEVTVDQQFTLDGIDLTESFLYHLSKKYSDHVIPTLKNVIVELNCSYEHGHEYLFGDHDSVNVEPDFKTIRLCGKISSKNVEDALFILEQKLLQHNPMINSDTLVLTLHYTVSQQELLPMLFSRST